MWEDARIWAHIISWKISVWRAILLLFLSAQNASFLKPFHRVCWRSVTTVTSDLILVEASDNEYKWQFFVDIPKLYFQLPCRFHTWKFNQGAHASLGPLMQAHPQIYSSSGGSAASPTAQPTICPLCSRLLLTSAPQVFPQAPWWLNVVMTTVTMETKNRRALGIRILNSTRFSGTENPVLKTLL